MRSAARSIVALMLTAVTLGAALYTLQGLGHVDPRGRASWSGTTPAFDATPRDVTLFVPACDAQAIVLHPAAAATGRVDAVFFVAAPDGSSRRFGSATVVAQPGLPITLPLGEGRPPWRTPLTLRLAHPDGLLTLDPQRPFSLDLAPPTRLGHLGCAFDGATALPGVLLVVAAMVIVAFGVEVSRSWFARALHMPEGRQARRDGPVIAMVAAGATLITYLLVVPLFEPPDELAHLQYARFVATSGTLPRAVPPPDSEWRAASYEFVQQPLYYLGAAALLKSTGLETPGPALTLNPRSRMRPGGTEPTIFQHGAVPANATGHRALRLLRLVSVLMALATTWLVARLLTTVSADPLVIATVAGGLGLIPQWCAVMGAVSTDPPATLLASAATLSLVRVASGRRGRGWLLMTGGLIGAAYAVKATAAFLVPMALLACVLGATVRPPGPGQDDGVRAFLRAGLRAALLIGTGIVLAGGWVHLRAWIVFGDPSARAFKRAVLEAGGFVPTRGPMPWTAEFWTQMRVMVFEPFWARFGSLGAGPFPGSRVWLPYAAATVLLVVLACWSAIGSSLAAWRRIRRSPLPRPDGPLGERALPSTPERPFAERALPALPERPFAERALPALHALSVCGLGVCVGLAAWIVVNLVPQADMVVHWTPRHVLPLTAPAALLVGAGLERLRHAPALVRRGGAAVTGLTVVALTLAWFGVLRATILMFHFGY